MNSTSSPKPKTYRKKAGAAALLAFSFLTLLAIVPTASALAATPALFTQENHGDGNDGGAGTDPSKIPSEDNSEDQATELTESINKFFDQGIGLFIQRLARVVAFLALLFGIWKLFSGIFKSGGGGSVGQAMRQAGPSLVAAIVLLFLQQLVLVIAFILIRLIGGFFSWIIDQLQS